MDKKLYPNLDPKLKDVYDRVMGFKPSPAPTAPSPAIAYSPPSSTPKPASNPVPFIANNNISSTKKNSSVSSVVVIVVTVIFFLVYALFWMKLFNIQFPFSLPF